MKKLNIAVDFDGTLCQYDGFKGHHNLGEFVPSILNLVIALLKKGHEVSIFTARTCNGGDDAAIAAHEIARHLSTVGLGHLEVTCIKQQKFDIFIDDRSICVDSNRGAIKFYDSLMEKHPEFMEVYPL